MKKSIVLAGNLPASTMDLTYCADMRYYAVTYRTGLSLQYLWLQPCVPSVLCRSCCCFGHNMPHSSLQALSGGHYAVSYSPWCIHCLYTQCCQPPSLSHKTPACRCSSSSLSALRLSRGVQGGALYRVPCVFSDTAPYERT